MAVQFPQKQYCATGLKNLSFYLFLLIDGRTCVTGSDMDATSRKVTGWRGFVWYHLPAIVYAAVIITLSSIPNLKAPQLRFLAFDKLAHFGEYAVFSWLAIRSISNLGSRLTANLAFILAILFVSGFAFIDESYQRFIPGRQFDVYDILIDVLGALLVLTLYWLLHRRAKETND